MQIRRNSLHLALCVSLLVSNELLCAQTNCPGYTQMNGVPGMSNTAQMSMELVDTADGDFSPDQVQAAQNAIDGLTGLPGNNMDATVDNTDTAPGENYNTASNPLMVVEIGTQADVDAVGANCTGAIACTQPYVSNGVTVGSKTVVLQAYATTYLQQVLTHEFVVCPIFCTVEC